MDWDSNEKSLSKFRTIIVQKMPHLGYACSCDIDRHTFMNKVSSCTSEDVDELYAGCIHAEAAKEFCRKFKDLYGIEENSEEMTSSGWFIHNYIFERHKETLNIEEDCLWKFGKVPGINMIMVYMLSKLI
ncbi:uncharacterized protein LOC134254397 [Saccostrea cucullata]|uniref:uncharacterized protein LOC134254397 n=1 Tax=Saccostrea cuccullata TaxID=36930 RepID=UPI002ED51128